MLDPDEIEHCGDQPEKAPHKPRGNAVPASGISGCNIPENQPIDYGKKDQLHDQHHKGEAVAISQRSERGKQLSFNAFGEHDDQIAEIHENQHGKNKLADVVADGRKDENDIKQSEDHIIDRT